MTKEVTFEEFVASTPGMAETIAYANAKSAKLPLAECLAHVDQIIRSHIDAGTLQAGPIAHWHDGERIIVKGNFHSKGNWAFRAIRWYTEGREKMPGMFSRGLALYGSLRADVPGLPVVK